MNKTKTKKNPVVLTKAELNKFWEKLTSSFEKYHYAYMMWQNHVRDYNEKYNGFGLPKIQMPPHIITYEIKLLKTHVDMEISNPKNTIRYKFFLVRFSKVIAKQIKEDAIKHEEFLREQEKKRKVKKQVAKKRDILKKTAKKKAAKKKK